MSSLSKSEPTTLVTGIYLSDYDRIVKPQQRFLIPNYFINYWLRQLGPTLAWIVVSLQQACWRQNGDQCTISQSTIADEIGLERRTVGRILKENPLRHWYIPEVEYQKGRVDPKSNSYQPLPYKYTVYLSTPLTPEHLAGLYEYFRRESAADQAAGLDAAINQLLSLKGKAALALLEDYQAQTRSRFTAPLPLPELVELALKFKFKNLPPARAAELTQKLAGLHSHLTEIGYTNCRQYFRLNWVARLGPAMAWLVMGLRSRCYYNPDTGEHRDICAWRKKELAALLGQSRYNLRLLLAHPYAEHFFQIIEQHKQQLTLRVSMIQEPLIAETAAGFWERQARAKNVEKSDMTPTQNVEKYDSTPAQNVEFPDMTLSENVEKSDMTPSETLKNVTSPPQNVEIYDTCKYFKESVPNPKRPEDYGIETLWDQILGQLRLQMTRGTFEAWLKDTRLITRQGLRFTVAVKSEFAREWLQNRLLATIQRAVASQIRPEHSQAPPEVEIIFVVDL